MKKKLLFLVLSSYLLACQQNPPSTTATTENLPTMLASEIDWQGHRGARGLMPENTIPAFLLALEYPQLRTLELDVVVTRDGEVVVSHEPWMSADICSHPDGRPVDSLEAKSLNIYEMSLDEVQAFDCGLRGHPRFPRQHKQAAYKPALRALIATVEQRSRSLERMPPQYNIELKSEPEWDGVYTPTPKVFAQLVADVLDASGVGERVTIQSFDPRALRAMRALKPELSLALLVANPRSIQDNLDSLGFQPDIYSPYFLLCSQTMLDTLHGAGIQVIPWTVNELSDMRKLMELGVDGIITDYPDLIGKL